MSDGRKDAVDILAIALPVGNAKVTAFFFFVPTGDIRRIGSAHFFDMPAVRRKEKLSYLKFFLPGFIGQIRQRSAVRIGDKLLPSQFLKRHVLKA